MIWRTESGYREFLTRFIPKREIFFSNVFACLEAIFSARTVLGFQPLCLLYLSPSTADSGKWAWHEEARLLFPRFVGVISDQRLHAAAGERAARFAERYRKTRRTSNGLHMSRLGPDFQSITLILRRFPAIPRSPGENQHGTAAQICSFVYLPLFWLTRGI